MKLFSWLLFGVLSDGLKDQAALQVQVAADGKMDLVSDKHLVLEDETAEFAVQANLSPPGGSGSGRAGSGEAGSVEPEPEPEAGSAEAGSVEPEPEPEAGSGEAGSVEPEPEPEAGAGEAGSVEPEPEPEAGSGEAGSGKAGSGKAGSGKAGSGKAGSGKAGSGKAGSGKAGSGKAGSGKAGSGKAEPEPEPEVEPEPEPETADKVKVGKPNTLCAEAALIGKRRCKDAALRLGYVFKGGKGLTKKTKQSLPSKCYVVDSEVFYNSVKGVGKAKEDVRPICVKQTS